MTLANNEKKFLIGLLKEKLEEIKVDDNFTNVPLSLVSSEIKYEDFINDLIKKLK